MHWRWCWIPLCMKIDATTLQFWIGPTPKRAGVARKWLAVKWSPFNSQRYNAVWMAVYKRHGSRENCWCPMSWRGRCRLPSANICACNSQALPAQFVWPRWLNIHPRTFPFCYWGLLVAIIRKIKWLDLDSETLILSKYGIFLMEMWP
jgi:hypothetical protein